ncbi:MAG: sulfite exporter TauE/SafE family protein [Chloroflexi bacterium CFX7]|nr:sulfite exporter TauE/SafE family protein [Chloroflexi bacterium CFX7]RIL01553.1 MAG: sulfite exporter TauE/SafE family protein [bacterium]
MESTDLLLLPLGAAVGAFGTLVGAGGGFVLVPILLLIYPHAAAEDVTATSLFVVCANAASGSLAYARQRRTDYRSGAWFALATLPGAVTGAIVVAYVPRRTFDGIFAAVLIALGLWLTLHAGATAIRAPVTGRGVVRRVLRDADGNTFVYSFQLWKGIALSAGIGFLSSLLGIGGGVIHVPVMATVLHFPIHVATATSQFVLMFMAAEGTSVHFATGALAWNEWLGRAVLLAVGAAPGAQAGAWFARRVHQTVIIRALSAALVLVGVRLALKALGL